MRYSSFIEADGALADELRFLARAVSGDETRYFMNFLFVEPSEEKDEREDKDKTFPMLRGVASDGRRLHLVDPLCKAAGAVHGMEPGFYRVLKVATKVWLARCAEAPGQFPNYRKVIPTGEVKYTTTFDGFALSGRKMLASFPDVLRMFREFPEPSPLNLNYLADLGRDATWTAEWREKNRAVTFRSSSRLAVIMTMQAE